MPEPGLVVATTYEPEVAQVEDLAVMLADSGLPALVVDNSTTVVSRDLVSRACAAYGIEVIANDRNIGTAGALNVGLRRARSLRATWMLYFDQDSRVGEGFWSRAAEVVDLVEGGVGAVGSFVVHVAAPDAQPRSGSALEPATYVISSGTMFRVADLCRVGGFDERLALDLVDHEICLRLRGAGRAVVIDSGRHISHEIGRGSRRTGVRGTRVTRHPRWRRRMMWRNSVVLCRRHAGRDPGLCLRHVVGRFWETWAGAVVFRDPTVLFAAAQGILDGWRTETSVVGIDAACDDPGRASLP